jgi:hypothetical protein
VLREFSGGVHLLAVVACGLDPKTAHYLSRPDVFFNFGWEPGDVPVVTDEDRARLRRANEMTEQLMAPAFGVLDQDGTDALLHGLRIMRKAKPDPA